MLNIVHNSYTFCVLPTALYEDPTDNYRYLPYLFHDFLICQDVTDIEEMSAYYRLNLFHVICLNSVFQSCFPRSRMVSISGSENKDPDSGG